MPPSPRWIANTRAIDTVAVQLAVEGDLAGVGLLGCSAGDASNNRGAKRSQQRHAARRKQRRVSFFLFFFGWVWLA